MQQVGELRKSDRVAFSGVAERPGTCWEGEEGRATEGEKEERKRLL